MPYVRVLLVSAFLIPSVLLGQTPANAPPDAVFHAVTYVETRAPAAKTARATLEQYRDASRKQDGVMRVEFFEQIGRPGHFALIEAWRDQRRLTRGMSRRRSSSWARSSRSA